MRSARPAAAAYDSVARRPCPTTLGAPEVADPAEGHHAASTPRPFTLARRQQRRRQPDVRVERLVDGRWATYADQTGEVQTRARPARRACRASSPYRASQQEWKWTANFEAVDFFPRNIDAARARCPTGTYRFVVDGSHRGERRARGRTTSSRRRSRCGRGRASRSATCSVDRRAARSRSASRRSPTRAPTSRRSRSSATTSGKPICKTCTFRPWASTGEIAARPSSSRRANGVTVVRVPPAAGDRTVGRQHQAAARATPPASSAARSSTPTARSTAQPRRSVVKR